MPASPSVTPSGLRHETVALAADRLDAATAVLDARLLSGDPELFTAAADPVSSALRADPAAFAEGSRATPATDVSVSVPVRTCWSRS